MTGIFALSRNPIYVAFGFVLLGQFLLFSNWIFWSIWLAPYGCSTVRCCVKKNI